MKKDKIKVYIYTRVSTTIQVDGYSLDAQKARMKAFAEYNDYKIVGEYEDAGKSGKSIEGRLEFNRMMEDIKSGSVFQYFFVLYILLSPILCFYGCMFNMQNIQKKQKNPAAYAAGLHSNPNQK